MYNMSCFDVYPSITSTKSQSAMQSFLDRDYEAYATRVPPFSYQGEASQLHSWPCAWLPQPSWQSQRRALRVRFWQTALLLLFVGKDTNGLFFSLAAVAIINFRPAWISSMSSRWFSADVRAWFSRANPTLYRSNKSPDSELFLLHISSRGITWMWKENDGKSLSLPAKNNT